MERESSTSKLESEPDQLFSLHIENSGIVTGCSEEKTKNARRELPNGRCRTSNSKWNVVPLLECDVTGSNSNIINSEDSAEAVNNDDSEAWSTLCVNEGDFNNFDSNGYADHVANSDDTTQQDGNQLDGHSHSVDNDRDIVKDLYLTESVNR